MSVYMTEEEQLAAIKAWWGKHQNLITALLSGVLLIFSGVKYWQWHTDKITHLASQSYERLMSAVAHEDGQSIEAYANTIIKEHPSMVYADAARLVLAKHYVSEMQWDKAKAELTQVTEHAKMPALQQVAILRLARLLIAEKSYDKAKEVLSKSNSEVYKPLVDELTGDIYAAEGKMEAAESIYRAALDEVKIRGLSSAFLDMKLSQFDVSDMPNASSYHEV